MGGRVRNFGRDGPVFRNPLLPPSVEQSGVGMAEQGEDPQGICRPPIEVVAVEDDGLVAADALGGHELGETVRVPVVTDQLIVELGMPVDLDGAGNVPGVVDQYVFVRFHDDHAGVVEVLGQPFGRDQLLGVGVRCELIVRHWIPPFGCTVDYLHYQGSVYVAKGERRWVCPNG